MAGPALAQLRQSDFPYLPRDCIETAEGLIFAVVSYHPHAEQVGCFLRYVRSNGRWQKVDTDAANRLLQRHFPHYLYTSEALQAQFHAVPPAQIVRHYQPEQALAALQQRKSMDGIEKNTQQLLNVLHNAGVLASDLGITGSVLIGQAGPDSDIDLVVYGRSAFARARLAVQQAIAEGTLQALAGEAMQMHYQRRLPELSYAEFCWHEARKFNKAMIAGRKFDLGMVNLPSEWSGPHERVLTKGRVQFRAQVVDDAAGFDFPARIRVDHPRHADIWVFTHTYVGQAKVGEWVEVSGAMECAASGSCRIVVGSSREATGEYIKVVREAYE